MAPSFGQRIKSSQLSLPLIGQGTWFLLSRNTRHFWRNYFCEILSTHHFNLCIANPLLLKNISIETLRVKLLTSNKDSYLRRGSLSKTWPFPRNMFIILDDLFFTDSIVIKKYLVNCYLTFNTSSQTAF